ncbi:Ribosomal RNA small subunit methyltransferase C [Candidatus Profftia lariciata]|uniref:16S rRNA (guanine(1207)-N(2))-methyltransferase RsmC n=1 Tax=Candidatus Profftia lariciata TaxID=1987921 RepID=UPI001D005252|nr:16S rRNA (guanine(1207)-N(2))-methyltransferase RsmC [Candidatus Profftia lariciata]UDG81783.1 Ribosomal RNA small subunit methyltransferase C [Candidatus Profftia lariciata]
MSLFTANSKLLMRHCEKFKSLVVCCTGDMYDTFPAILKAQDVYVYTDKYNYWQQINNIMDNKHCYFGLLINFNMITECNALIYYWPKSKQEAKFHLHALFSLMSIGTKIFIIGENNAGVRSSVNIIKTFGSLKKIDGAYRCSLYYGCLEKKCSFNMKDWWGTYQIEELTIATLPGIFSCDGLDIGSELLLSSIKLDMYSKVLDIGCGTGVLSAIIAKRYPHIRLTLTDVSAVSLNASYVTFITNNIQGIIIPSNVYSNVTGYFNTIISNPPFHNGIHMNLSVAKKLIYGAVNHLYIGGKLYIVANKFLPYQQMLDDVFGTHEIISEAGCFRVYLACMSYTNIMYKDN